MATITCLDCGGDYPALMALSLLIPRSQWLLIHPDDNGVLCANCILSRAARLPNVINVTGLITFAEDYREEPTIYHTISALAGESEETS